METTDQILARIAAPQCGAFRLEQALRAGVTYAEIASRRRRGSAFERHPCTYVLGHDGPVPDTETWAALLAVGEDGILTLESAAYAWRVSRETSMPGPELLVSRYHRPLVGVPLLESRTVHQEDRMMLSDGRSVASPERTIVDLAMVRSEGQLGRYLREADYRRVLDHARMRRTIERNRNRPGAARMRRAYVRYLEGDLGVDNRAEERFARMLRDAGVGRVTCNKMFRFGKAIVRVDIFLEEYGVAVELDERSHELAPVQREDRLKWSLLEAKGIAVVHADQYDLLAALTVVLDFLALHDTRVPHEELLRARHPAVASRYTRT